MIKRITYLLFIGTLGCTQVQSNLDQYYDLDGLISNNEKSLAREGVFLEKSVTIDGQSEYRYQESNTVLLKTEFDALRHFAINDPAMAGAYDEIVIGNQTMFQLKEGEQSPVKFFALERNGEIETITSKRLTENRLYTEQKDFSMTIANGVIRKFKIVGFQKMIMKDTVFYQISVKISEQ